MFRTEQRGGNKLGSQGVRRYSRHLGTYNAMGMFRVKERRIKTRNMNMMDK